MSTSRFPIYADEARSLPGGGARGRDPSRRWAGSARQGRLNDHRVPELDSDAVHVELAARANAARSPSSPSCSRSPRSAPTPRARTTSAPRAVGRRPDRRCGRRGRARRLARSGDGAVRSSIGEIRASDERGERPDRPLLRALRRPAARPARALGVAALRARRCAASGSTPAAIADDKGQLWMLLKAAETARGRGRAPGQPPLRLRRRGGDRRPLDRRLARGRRARAPTPPSSSTAGCSAAARRSSTSRCAASATSTSRSARASATSTPGCTAAPR